jgi:hypothetical protein
MKTFLGYEVMDALDHTVRRARILFTRELVRKGLDPLTWNPIKFQGSKAYTDGTTIWLPNLKQDARVTLAEFQCMQGYALHEIGHVIFSDFTTWGESSVLKRMHNAVEDLWEEHKLQSSGLISGSQGLFKQLAESMLKPDVDWSIPGNYSFGLVIHGRGSSGTVENLQIARDIITAINECLNDSDDSANDSANQSANGGENSDDSENDEQDQGDTGDESANVLNENDVLKGEEIEPSLEVGGERTDEEAHDLSFGDPLDCHYGSHAIDNPIPARLRMEVRNIFDNTDNSGFSHGHRSGSLDASRLSQYRTDSIFMRREEPDQIDSSCVILVDLSYSMEGLMDVVASTVYALTDSLRGIPHVVMGFADKVYMLKSWTHPQERFKGVCKRLSPCGGTQDYSANRHAQALLLHRGEKRRIVFVITDGMGNPETAALVKSGERMGIQTIGIGIGLDVKSVYPKSIRVNDVAELGKASFRQIKLAA